MALRPEPPRTALSLFSGGGGLDLGLRRSVVGLRTVCYVEREAYAAAVLVARMEDASLDPAPIWDDVASFCGKRWRGLVDVVHGGFPCQDISNAGKRAGISGERSGLWREFRRIVSEVQPRFVFVENVGALVSRGLDVVLGDLAAMGFDAEWGCFRASDAGAPHRRERVFILAHSQQQQQLRDESGWRGGESGTDPTVAEFAGSAMAHGGGGGCESLWERGLLDRERATRGNDLDGRRGPALADGGGGGGLEGVVEDRPAPGPAFRSHPPFWPPRPDDLDGWRDVLETRPDLEPAICRMVDGSSSRVDRLRVLGNGVVPAQAALAWRTLWGRLP